MKRINIFKKISYKFNWINILFSPFERPNITFYLGDIKMGTPYFLPRRSIKISKKEAWEKANKIYYIYNKNRVRNGIDRESKTINTFYKHYKNQRRYEDLKWGIGITPLGWKTKFKEIRHEYNPQIYIVGFNKQLVISFGLKDTMANMCYWEAWLTYKNIKESHPKTALCRSIISYSATWSHDRLWINYWHDILKNKYKHILRGDRASLMAG